MRQLTFSLQPVTQTIICKVRPDGRVEARWRAEDLCTTCKDWPTLIEIVLARFLRPDVKLKVRA